MKVRKHRTLHSLKYRLLDSIFAATSLCADAAPIQWPTVLRNRAWGRWSKRKLKVVAE